MLSPEAFCDNVKTVLQASLGAALQAQTDAWAARDADADRVVKLPDPRDTDYYIGGVTTVLRYPTVEIAVSDLTLNNFSIENFDGDVRPRLMIRGLFQDARSIDLLYRQACRWAAAVISVAATPGIFGPVEIDHDQGLRASWRYNPEANENDEVQTGVLLVFPLLGALSPFVA